MTKLRYRNLLSIKHGGKGIPYGGAGELRPDGDANYGFKNLKGRPELLDSVPELLSDPALSEAVKAINAAQTGLFSVGCTSGDIVDENGHRRTGYVEFAFNSASLVADASNYFPLYFHFDRYLSSSESTLQVAYEWELMQAHFLDTNVGGFTCSVFLNTFYVGSSGEAQKNWAEAIALLTHYLGGIPQRATDYLYAVDG
ncbi:MAG: hypothetical protein HY018_00385 [Hydrogenophilales bacterium]|nr:hypothetical protein [Hydrogenophilales bacterium]